MRPIKINLEPSFLDGYIYLGILFLISHNGELCSIPMENIIKKLEVSHPQYSGFFKLAFLRNDWLNNKQSKLIFGNQKFHHTLIESWKEVNNLQLNIILNEEEITKHHEVPSMPIFDFKLYEMKLFMGHRDGLHECHINSNEDIFKSLRKPEKIFDARSTFLSAKSGELMISSNSDGLFRGSFQGVNKNVNVNNKVLSPKSIRTGWSSYDVINYSNQSTFNYFENKTKKPDKNEQRIKRYSIDDETSDKTKIEEFGVKKYSIQDLFEQSLSKSTNLFNYNNLSRLMNLGDNFDLENIDFSFDSNEFCFFCLKNGKILTVHLSKDKRRELVRFKRNFSFLPINLKEENFGSIISSSIIPRGCVIELFEAVMVVQNEKHYVIEDEPALSVKTFPSSRRFRNLILAFKDEGFSMHSTFPIDFAYSSFMEDFETDLPF